MNNILTRRAVALDLLPSEEADLGVYEFFHAHEPTPSGLMELGEETKEEELEAPVKEEEEAFEEEEEQVQPKVKLFKPLVFPPRVVPKGGHISHQKHGHGTSPAKDKATEIPTVDESQMVAAEAVPLASKTGFTMEPEEESSVEDIEKYDDSHIIKATRKDYFFTGLLFCVMAALVGVVVGWDTHLDESDSIFGPVGLACKTPCRGDIYDQDYFRGQNTFKTGESKLLFW